MENVKKVGEEGKKREEKGRVNPGNFVFSSP
jgi:hypothetical protein